MHTRTRTRTQNTSTANAFSISSFNIIPPPSPPSPPSRPTFTISSTTTIRTTTRTVNCNVRVSTLFQHQMSNNDEHEEGTESSLLFTSNHNNNNNIIDRRSAIMSSISGAVLLSNTNIIPNEDGLMSINLNTKANAAVTTTISTSTSNQIPNWTLDNNVQFPTLALNTVALTAQETELSIKYATKQGITHVDFHPGKERDGVALYLKNHPNSRNNLFLNTKIRKAPPGTTPSDAAKMAQDQITQDLNILGVDHVDMLMLRDSPDCEVIQAQWKVMENALASGKTRSIGVINFCEKALTCVLEVATVKPSINYFMWHVGMGGKDSTGRKLREFGESRGIRTFAYGAVGEPGPSDELLSNPLLQKIGTAHDNKTPEEVALKWVIQSGCAVSSRPTLNFGLGTGVCSEDNEECEVGLAKRAKVFDWSLTKAEMKALNAVSSPNDNPTLFSSAGCPNAFVMPKK